MNDGPVVFIPDWPPEPEEFWTIVIMRNEDGSMYYKLVPASATRGPITEIHELEEWAEWVNTRIDPITIASVDGLQAALDSKATPGDIVAAINVVVAGAPSDMDNLNELAQRIIADEATVAALAVTVAGKEPIITAGLTTQVWQGDKTWTTKLGLPISTATQTALNAKEGTITAGTTSQYWRGDKSWQTLDKGAVGLGNVDNTSDANKPISTATQTALDGKMNAVPTVSTPSRTINSAGFQISTTRPAMVSYTIKTQATNPLIAGSSVATVQLMSDAASTPTTERGRVEATSSVGLAVAIAITTSNTATLTYLVPAAHYVRLVGASSGGGVNTLVAQVEEIV